MSRLSICLCVSLVLSVGLFSCSSQPPDDVPTPTEDAQTATRVLTPTIDTATPATGGGIAPLGPITLTLWTTEEFAPTDKDAGGRLLQDQLLVFDRSKPDVTVDAAVKRPSGPGGIIEYLRNASQVAPAVLPDIAVLSSQMLRQAAAEEYVQPLDDLLQPETLAGLFPVADELGRIGGDLMGIPFRLDFEHLVYNSSILTSTAPTTWDAILDSGGPYLFPAAEDAPVNATLIHYLAAGGTLLDKQGQPRFEIDPLTEVFRFYQRADLRHVIPVSVLQTHSLASSWDAYRSGNALIAHVDAAAYLSGRAGQRDTAVAAISGPEKAAVPLVSGWHWVIVTSNPSRQQVAAELLDRLMASNGLGVWSYASRWLPASGQAFDIWPQEDQYVEFAREQLLAALPHPGAEYHQAVQPGLAQAVRDVLLGKSSPAAAAATSIP